MTSPAPTDLDGVHRPVVVIGGGQAGLSMSRHLVERGVDHLVLERHRVAHEWRERRWDTFCLVTPNWQCRLPGFPYAGPDPDGFMPRDQVVAYLEAFAGSFAAPVVEGVAVLGLRRAADGAFVLHTSAGTLTADAVVLATGPYQRPVRPRWADLLPASVRQVHSAEYRNPDTLPPGAVLVVGSGQSGCQIAEDLHLAGRTVHLATGGAPRVARRYRGRDVVAWLDEMGHYRRGVEEFGDTDGTREKVNHYVTGRDGGRDIDLRARALEGLRLHGRALGVEDGAVRFADDLEANLDTADAVSESIKDAIDAHVASHRIPAPSEARYAPVWRPAAADAPTRTRLDLAAAGVGTVLWATGFARDDAWIRLPVFDGGGRIAHRRGVTPEPGFTVLGLPWLHTWCSGRFCGVGDDAGYLADRLVAHLAALPAGAGRTVA